MHPRCVCSLRSELKTLVFLSAQLLHKCEKINFQFHFACQRALKSLKQDPETDRFCVFGVVWLVLEFGL